MAPVSVSTLTPPTNSLSRAFVGQTIGKYAITGQLGIGNVYRATHIDLRRERALKVICREADAAQHERISHEARLLGRIEHPNIIRVIDFHSDSQVTYLVMELLDGESMFDLLNTSGRLEVAKALEIVLHLADGLNYIATQGIIHRDIQPANILITKSGVPKLAGLGSGFVKLPDNAAFGKALRTNADARALHYMAPEQVVSPNGIDLRADIYALGSVFYHMVTGTPPCVGVEPKRIAHLKAQAAATNAPLFESPHERLPSLPTSVSKVIMRMLVANPGQRYPDYMRLLDDLCQLRVLLERTTSQAASASTATGMPMVGGQSHDSTRLNATPTVKAPAGNGPENFTNVLRMATAALTGGDRSEARRLLLPWKNRAGANEAYWLLLTRTAMTPQEGVDFADEGLKVAPQAQRLASVREQFAQRVVATTRKCPFCSAVYPMNASTCGECGGRANFTEPRIWQTHQPLQAAIIRRCLAAYAKAAEQQPDVRWTLAQAMAHLNLREYPEAYDYLQQALAQYSDYPGLKEQAKVVAEWLQAVRLVRGQIVVIDDSPTVRRMLETKLREYDYEVICFNDGDSAIAQLPDLQADVIVLDVNMPGRDGYQVCSWIKRHPQLKQTPVVLLTGDDGFFDKLRGKMAGANRHIGKPFNGEALLQLIDKFIAAKKS